MTRNLRLIHKFEKGKPKMKREKFAPQLPSR